MYHFICTITSSVSQGEDYQELTQREEKDLEDMISETENAISHIEAFTEQLSKELSGLDGVIKYKKLRKCNVDQTAEIYFILINYQVPNFRQSFANLDVG